MQTESLLYFIAERLAVQHKKDAGEPRPWTNDPILDEGKFCHIERERDRTTARIREKWREPHADNPDLWFAMRVARRINHWPTLAEIGFPVPWNAEQFLAIMRRVRRTANLALTVAPTACCRAARKGCP